MAEAWSHGTVAASASMVGGSKSVINLNRLDQAQRLKELSCDLHDPSLSIIVLIITSKRAFLARFGFETLLDV
jgi:hypothetical protein